jgi:hypothetical protein
MALRQHGEDDITLVLARIRQAKSARQPGAASPAVLLPCALSMQPGGRDDQGR